MYHLLFHQLKFHLSLIKSILVSQRIQFCLHSGLLNHFFEDLDCLFHYSPYFLDILHIEHSNFSDFDFLHLFLQIIFLHNIEFHRFLFRRLIFHFFISSITSSSFSFSFNCLFIIADFNFAV
eukprot:UN29049